MRPYKHKGGGKITFITRHDCKLDPLDLRRDLPCVAPFSASYKKYLDNLKKVTLVSRLNPEYKVYFRSKCALYKEKARHLRDERYRMVIHPLSRLAMIREIVACILWVAAFIIDPLFNTFLACYLVEQDSKVRNYIQLLLNCFLFVDIVLQFFIGFIVKRTKEIVLDRRRIVKHYFGSFFFYDFVPVFIGILKFVINVSFVRTLFSTPHETAILISIPQLYCLRFVRIYSVVIYLANILRILRVRESAARCTIMALVTLIVIHWWTCFLFLVPAVSYYLGFPFAHSWVLKAALGTGRTLDNLYIECLLCTVCHFFGSGKGNIRTHNPIEQLLLAVMLMCGLTCYVYIIASVLQLFGTINVSETKYEELIYQLNEYMVTKKLPPPLRKRLLMYYEYRFQKQFFMESAILNSLSEHLRYEVILYNCKNVINKVKLFQVASKEVVGALVALLKHEIFLPNDSILKPDAVNEHVFFISFGTVTVYLPNGREVFHLEDGHHFGEMLVLADHYEQVFVSVIAVEITDVFYLDKTDFWYMLSANPELADSLEKSALAKLAMYKALMKESDEDAQVDTSDILMELRRGHILNRGRERN